MNKKIKEEINNIEIPKELHERSKLGIKKAKLDSPKGTIKAPLIAIALVVALVFGSIFVPPSFANTLQSIPFIGSIFEMIGDKGLQEAEKLGYSDEINEIITLGDTSLKITDVLYDGSRLSIGFVVTNYKNENPFNYASFYVGEEDIFGGASSQGEYINDTDYAGVFKVIVPNEVQQDSFNLNINFREFNGKKGDWNLNIPVTKVDGKAFFVTEQTVSKDYIITMKKVTLTPATTELKFDLSEPVDAEKQNQIIRFRLYDDKGNELEEISAGGSGCDECEVIDGKITLDTSVQYEPLEKIPDYLILEPYISSSNEKIDKLRMKIPLLKDE